MLRRLPTRWRVVVFVSWIAATQAQKCYYPTGNEAPEKPCSTKEGAACCPHKWQCLDNGLCYYKPDGFYGRYSCTDKSWKSPHCPSNLCTYNMGPEAFGAEAVSQCSGHNNDWCCDGDRVNVECCKRNNRPFFALQDGKAYATIGSGSTPSEAPTLATISGAAKAENTGGGGKSSDPPSSATKESTDSPSSTGDASSIAVGKSSSEPTPVTSLQTSMSSGTAGVSTIIITSVIAPAASSTSSPEESSSSSSSKSKIGVIVGCAVGIPLALALIGIIAWMLYRRRKNNQNPYRPSTPEPFPNSSEFAGGAKLHKPQATTYKSEIEVPELASQAVGPGRPISIIKGHAELDSGAGFAPGTVPHAPHLVGVGGGNGMGHTPQSSWGSAPPGYSPGMNQGHWGNGVSGGGVPAMSGGVPETTSIVTEGGQYIPYRPPQTQSQMQYIPEMAELSAVRTPPAT
ncbi:hypothetical protein K469DRAFT_355060 [Zopfia rhizophila CBS 207.26]|uniref:Mid2 domain-containing protein n=1 Tax=Zopfia rhizophila CBS 207.26 TaxID=1314779 RepID=A0A6A6DJI0_9PEZI|nr:hypothetical protein K469DRAFT_355060 [Zopfia rhizophila CBS 207.26]